MELRTHGLMLVLDLLPPDGEGWMAAPVTVQAPGFNGAFECCVWRSDLQSFRSELTQMIRHVGKPSCAELTSTEPGIDLRLSMNRAGQIEGRYALQNSNCSGQPELSGTFEMDQSFL